MDSAETTGASGERSRTRYAGTARLDNFSVIPVRVAESFDTTPPGGTPAGWRTWVSDATGTLGAGTGRTLSPPHGYASTGNTPTAARAWADLDLPADTAASAAVYLDTLIPARVFVRGTNLDTPTPTYYAAGITRGLEVKLVRVVDGVETVLGSLRLASRRGARDSLSWRSCAPAAPLYSQSKITLPTFLRACTYACASPAFSSL